jgi:hypothetical protein
MTRVIFSYFIFLIKIDLLDSARIYAFFNVENNFL